jgi:hypothetical protein
MAPHCLGASKEAGCVSNFMANLFRNINFYFALSGFSVQVCAQVGLRGIAGGGGGRGAPPRRQQSSRGGKTNILSEKIILVPQDVLNS